MKFFSVNQARTDNRPWRAIGLMVCGLLIAACNNQNTDPPRLDLHIIGVRGIATDGNGSPLAGASIGLTAFRGSCDTGVGDGTGQATTDANGAYSTTISSSHREGARCIRVDAIKAELTGSTTVAGVAFPVRFPTDTVLIDITLR